MSYGVSRKYYSIGDAEEIILQSNKKDLIFTIHSFKRESKRNISEEYVKKAILELDYLDITQDGGNEFKLYYPSQTQDNKELIIVIAINDDKKIIIQSVWEEKRYK